MTRLASKEVIVVMLSDLDRMNQPDIPHAIPVAYGLAGYSLKTENIRRLLLQVLIECAQRNLHVPVLSSDGQFYKLAVQNINGDPLTVLQVAKSVWKFNCSIPKAVQVSNLMNVNYPGPIHSFTEIMDTIDIDVPTQTGSNVINGPIRVHGLRNQGWEILYTPPLLSKLILCPTTLSDGSDRTSLVTTCEIPDELIDLPTEVLQTLPSETIDNILQISPVVQQMNSRTQGNMHQEQGALEDINDLFLDHEVQGVDDADLANVTDEMDYATTVQASVDSQMAIWETFRVVLIECDKKRQKKKFTAIDVNTIQQHFATAASIDKHFTRDELIACINSWENSVLDPIRKGLKQMRKGEIVNGLSHILGDSSHVAIKYRKNPKTLRGICKDLFSRKYPKIATNAITATRAYFPAITAWRNTSVYRNTTIGHDAVKYIWYSKPDFVKETSDHVLFMLDTHHLFVNARSLVCSKGIPAMGVYRDAFIRVVKSKKTKLHAAMVDDVIDRQSNSIAQIVFSEQVENVMRDNNDLSTAEFCRIIRRWYQAEDDPGLRAEDRFLRRLEMRNHLLSTARLSQFPPAGSYVSDMPVVMFEGFMTNIDRRLQLYVLANGGTYNVRCPNTLDSENFFGEFQSLDPRGMGVLSPDDIPQAMEAGSYILHGRLNPDRMFYMRTSRYPRVYQVHSREQQDQASENLSEAEIIDQRHYGHIDLV